MNIPRNARVGIVLKGGPVNGPFAPPVCSEIKAVLRSQNLDISGIYANSGTVPAGVMSSVDLDEECAQIWAKLSPFDIIGNDHSFLFKAASMYRLLRDKSIFPNAPLRRILDKAIPLDRVFSADAIPMKFMTAPNVDTNSRQSRPTMDHSQK